MNSKVQDSVWKYKKRPSMFVKTKDSLSPIIAIAKHTENGTCFAVYGDKEIKKAKPLELFPGYEEEDKHDTAWHTHVTRSTYRVPYQHYKGGLYELIALAVHSETNEPFAVYMGQDQHVWARPLDMFFEHVCVDEKRVRRFKLLKKTE